MVFFLLLEGRFGRVKSVRVCLDAACLFFLCRLSEFVLRRSLYQLVMQLLSIRPRTFLATLLFF